MTTKHVNAHENLAKDGAGQVDPHGFSQGHHHGHTILPLVLLRVVLVVLLLLTGLTVFAAQAEQWFVNEFHVQIPTWFNVAIVLVIATIKSVIVAAYFMQLKYDNPINTVLFLFCLFGFALFLGFTIIDLGGRDYVYAEKGKEITPGGTGNLTRNEIVNGKMEKVSITGPMYLYPRQKKIEELGPQKFAELEREALAHSHPHKPAPSPWSLTSANMSRSKTGTTGALDLTPPEPATGTHGESH
mgnify:CR=1 FL=1